MVETQFKTPKGKSVSNFRRGEGVGGHLVKKGGKIIWSNSK